ncbi:MAG TPA: protein-tyrosine-phosphatase [Phycisphaerae bacterium]|nr:protein-tyrosine-phosphatase [Phycisphaerae bacterium]
MNKANVVVVTAVALAGFASAADDSSTNRGKDQHNREKTKMNKPIAGYVSKRQAEFDQIDAKRKAQLEELSAYIRQQRAVVEPVRLTFVCTHNSRRSHMAQLWASVAAETYGIHATTYSGGTESTAFNPRAVAAMERAGFEIEKTTDDPNPIYHVRYADDRSAMTCFSKKHNSDPNPHEGFAAIMVCSDADRSCPAVRGATGRFAIPFVDPKAADGTPEEAATYDERCAQIAREMLYVMSRVAG